MVFKSYKIGKSGALNSGNVELCWRVQWVSNSYPTGTHDQGIMSLRSSSPEFSKYYQELGELFPLEQNLPCISADSAHTHPNIKGQIFAGSIQSSSFKRISYCTHYFYFKRLLINEKGFASFIELKRIATSTNSIRYLGLYTGSAWIMENLIQVYNEEYWCHIHGYTLLKQEEAFCIYSNLNYLFFF